MKRVLVLFVAFLFVSSSLYSQEKRWSWTVEAAAASSQLGEVSGETDGALFGTICPNFLLQSLGENSSLSLASFAGISAMSQTNVGGGTSSTSSDVFIKVPLMVMFNYGRLNTPIANNRVGIFTGLGPEFNYASFRYDDYKESATSFGMQFTAGFRFKLPFHLSPGASWSNAVNYSEQTLRFFVSPSFSGGSTLYGFAYGFAMFSKPELSEKRRGGGGSSGGYRYRHANKFKHSWLRKNRQRRYYSHDRTGRRGNSFQY